LQLSVLGLFWLLPLGCRLDENDPETSGGKLRWSWSAELDNYSAVEEHEWDTIYDEATVAFEAWDFDGLVRIEVFDRNREKIFDDTIRGNGDCKSVTGDTDDGRDGHWLIRITCTDVDGDLRIRMY
jgi:hypothetical protein